ncbi:acyltransferase [Desulfococcaceae bacterium HSG8]|nr:acyltransferase [Desulfococcaceae bacterium HSG8]
MGVLRYLLASIIVICHCGPIFGSFTGPSGATTVSIFMIISGFYMALVSQNYNSYKNFLLNRFLKIYPCYWLILSLTFIIFYWRLQQGYFNPLIYYQEIFKNEQTAFWYVIFQNIFLFGRNLFFKVDALFKLVGAENEWCIVPLPQGWSLEIEMLFYIAAPFINKMRLSDLAILFFLSLFCSLENIFYLRYLVFFILGALSYRIYRRINWEKINKKFKVVITILFFGLLLSYNQIISITGLNLNIIYYASATIAIPFIFELTKNNKWDRKIGELSYPLYLIHFSILWIFWTSNETRYMFAPHILIISTFISMVLMKYLLNPIEKKMRIKFKN